MPFASKLQLQTCFSKNLSLLAQNKAPKWDCEKWLQETKQPLCLPTLVDLPKPQTCSKKRKYEKNDWTVFYRGARGGIYFFVADMKVYVPADAKEYVESHFQILIPKKK